MTASGYCSATASGPSSTAISSAAPRGSKANRIRMSVCHGAPGHRSIRPSGQGPWPSSRSIWAMTPASLASSAAVAKLPASGCGSPSSSGTPKGCAALVLEHYLQRRAGDSSDQAGVAASVSIRAGPGRPPGTIARPHRGHGGLPPRCPGRQGRGTSPTPSDSLTVCGQRDRYQATVRRTASRCAVGSRWPKAASNLLASMTKGARNW